MYAKYFVPLQADWKEYRKKHYSVVENKLLILKNSKHLCG